jgi:tetratricopeptide (TPR) repeat protein
MFAEALQIADAVLGKKPDDIAVNNTKGRLLLKMGQTAKAREFLEKADKAAPMNIDRVKAMADMYLKLNDPNASVDKMKQLIALNPEQKDLKFDLFRDLETSGFIDHAIGLCKETTLPAEVVRHYNNKGVLLSKEGLNEKALEEYKASLKFYPSFKENYRIFFNIAIAEANQKTPESLQRAAIALDKCLELCPDFEKGQNLRLTIQQAQAGRHPKAG